MPKVGLSAVASAAGVSEATVSRVVNNPTMVAPETRRVVEAAMRSLGYARATPNLVLLITPGLSDVLFAQLCDRLAAALAPLGLRAVICSAPLGGTQELEYVTAMADSGAVGAIFVSASNTLEAADPAVPRLLKSRGIPFVCINGAFDGFDAPTLSADDARAAEIAVEHLWTLGHRRIGLIAGPAGNRPSDRRVEAFTRAMAQRGAAEPDRPVVRHLYSIEGGVAATAALLDRGPVTAIVAASDEMALGAIRASRQRGLAVPEDISLVGYDDALPLDFTDPPLTSVRQPLDRLAQAAAPMLARLVRDQDASGTELLFSPELFIRESTRAPRPE
jgi:LacI family repressor for deo operon, udp, cdd, tsx, nupC, and nupG